MKRTLLLSAFAALLVPLTGFANTAVVNGIEWHYTPSGQYAILDSPAIEWYDGDSEVVIPDSLGGYAVRTIPSRAFYGWDNIRAFRVPDSIDHVEEGAFQTCYSCTSIYFEGLPEFERDAFEDMGSSLQLVSLPARPEGFYDSDDFRDYVGLPYDCQIEYRDGTPSIRWEYSTNSDGNRTCTLEGTEDRLSGTLRIPEVVDGYLVTRIDGIVSWSSSSSADDLTAVIVPESVREIYGGAFSKCWNLRIAYFNGTPEEIDSYTFRNSSVELISFPCINDFDAESLGVNSSVEIVYRGGSYPPVRWFHEGNRLTSVENAFGDIEIPGTLDGYRITEISQNAFRDAIRMTSVVIPATVEYIDSYAFRNCSGLTQVSIPRSVQDVGQNAFYGCRNILKATIGTEAEIEWGEVFDSGGCLGEIEFMSCVSSIPSQPLRGHESLENVTTITIPESVTSIGEGAFAGCTGLRNITIPESVTHIGPAAFYNCSDLNVYFCGTPETLDEPFYKASVRCVSFPCLNDFSRDDLAVKSDCAIVYRSGSPAPIRWTYETIDKDCCRIIGVANAIGDVAIPATIDGYRVTGIGEYAFEDSKRMTGVIIPETVEYIDGYAFENCSGLAQVTIPSSVEEIGERAFYGCCNIMSATIGSDGNIKWGRMFQDSNILRTVVFEDGVTKIAASCFDGKKSLRSVTLPESVTAIGSQAFRNCSGLTSIAIPDNVTTIGVEAFSGCSGLESVAIPDSVTTIGYDAFFRCEHFTESVFSENGSTLWFVPPSVSGIVVLPETVARIGDHALSYNDGNIALLVVPDDCVFDGKNVGVSGSTRIVRYAEYFFDILTVELPEAECGVPYRAEFETTAEDDLSWRVLDASDGEAFSESELPPGLCLSGVAVEGTAELRGDWRFAVEAVNEFGLARTNWISLSVVSPGEGPLEWDVCSDVRWRTGGDVRWSVSDGGWFAESGEAGDGEETWIEASVRGPGVLSFEWSVSCENRNDSLQLFVDGVAKGRITDETGWRTHSVEVGPGRHEIRWVYAKNGSVSEGEDRAWLGSVEWTPSWTETENGFPEALETAGLDWWTSGDAEWIAVLTDDAADGMDCAWSGAVENGGVSRIETTVSGAGTLSFDLFVSGRQGIDWLDIFVDDEPAFSRTGEVPWTRETIELEDGDHVIAWEWFRGDYDAPESGFDQAGLDQVSWTPAKPASVVVEGVEIPVAWLDENVATIVAEYGGDYEAAAKAMAANGKNHVWECYVTGLSPTDAEARFEARIAFKNGEPVVTWTPDLNEGGTKSERVYTVEGKTNLVDQSWGPPNESTRFFRVKVSMP